MRVCVVRSVRSRRSVRPPSVASRACVVRRWIARCLILVPVRRCCAMRIRVSASRASTIRIAASLRVRCASMVRAPAVRAHHSRISLAQHRTLRRPPSCVVWSVSLMRTVRWAHCVSAASAWIHVDVPVSRMRTVPRHSFVMVGCVYRARRSLHVCCRATVHRVRHALGMGDAGSKQTHARQDVVRLRDVLAHSIRSAVQGAVWAARRVVAPNNARMAHVAICLQRRRRGGVWCSRSGVKSVQIDRVSME